MSVLPKDSSEINDTTVPTKPYLTLTQRQGMKQELSDLKTALDPNNVFRLRSDTDAAHAMKRVQNIERQLSQETPPHLSGPAKDKIKKMSDELEAKILQGMPTHEEMRKNPDGMVGRHIRHERANKKNIMRWKNYQRALEPNSDDPDLSNFERLRPSGEVDRMRTDAQIGGHMTYQSIPQEVWDLIFKHAPNSALAQAKANEGRKG